jgi:hypothetical protein
MKPCQKSCRKKLLFWKGKIAFFFCFLCRQPGCPGVRFASVPAAPFRPFHPCRIIPFYAKESELFDFHLFRFSFGETTEEATRIRKSKS